MVQYKTVAGPVGIVIKGNDNYDEAVRYYASIIEKEAVGGWELLCIQEVPVTKDKGCLAGCLAAIGIGTQYEHVTFNMLVFVHK